MVIRGEPQRELGAHEVARACRCQGTWRNAWESVSQLGDENFRGRGRELFAEGVFIYKLFVYNVRQAHSSVRLDSDLG